MSTGRSASGAISRGIRGFDALLRSRLARRRRRARVLSRERGNERVSTHTAAASSPCSGSRVPRPSPVGRSPSGSARLVYAVLLSIEAVREHHRFETFLDLAVYDQLLWLLANGHEPFSTVISRPLLGGHFQPGVVLLTPLYWLDLGVPGLLTAQSVALALTAPALYALARAYGASPRAGAAARVSVARLPVGCVGQPVRVPPRSVRAGADRPQRARRRPASVCVAHGHHPARAQPEGGRLPHVRDARDRPRAPGLPTGRGIARTRISRVVRRRDSRRQRLRWSERGLRTAVRGRARGFGRRRARLGGSRIRSTRSGTSSETVWADCCCSWCPRAASRCSHPSGCSSRCRRRSTMRSPRTGLQHELHFHYHLGTLTGLLRRRGDRRGSRSRASADRRGSPCSSSCSRHSSRLSPEGSPSIRTSHNRGRVMRLRRSSRLHAFRMACPSQRRPACFHT